jgi:DNA-binding PadR family transcriptional regulator
MGEMWKIELETLRSIDTIAAAKMQNEIKIIDIFSLFPNILPRSIYYRIERLVEHELITRRKEANHIFVSITDFGRAMLQ